MNELAATTNIAQNTKEAAELAATAVEATKGIDWPQAAVLISGICAAGAIGCYLINSVKELVQGNHVKKIVIGDSKVVFNATVQAA